MAKKIAVLGAGPAGYVAAIRGAQLGSEIYLIENREVGGTCLNRGCIPTKTFYRNAEIMSNIRKAKDFGIEVGDPKIDGQALQKRKIEVVDPLVKGIEHLISSYDNIKFFNGEASLLDKNTIKIEGQDGTTEEISVDIIVIATGSKPTMTETKGIELDKVITSDELLDLDVIPERLIVVGGGVIGLEFASIYKELGSEVVLLASRILKDADKEISRRLVPILKKQGIETYVDIRAKEISKEGDKLKVLARYKEKDEEVEVVGDYVLIASGRGPVIEGLNLDKVGVDYEKWGIKVDEDYKTSVDNIYAIGDVNGSVQLAHVASAQGVYLMEKLHGLDSDINFKAYPNCVFTMTEVAHVGYTEEELKEKEIKYKSSKFMYAANGKALSLGEGDGMIKVLADEEGSLLGVHILGPHANDLIAEPTLAIANNMNIDDIARTIHAHPTLSEAFMEASLGLENRAVHIAPPRKRRSRK